MDHFLAIFNFCPCQKEENQKGPYNGLPRGLKLKDPICDYREDVDSDSTAASKSPEVELLQEPIVINKEILERILAEERLIRPDEKNIINFVKNNFNLRQKEALLIL